MVKPARAISTHHTYNAVQTFPTNRLTTKQIAPLAHFLFIPADAHFLPSLLRQDTTNSQIAILMIFIVMHQMLFLFHPLHFILIKMHFS